MEFSENICSIIERRKSSRTYKMKEIDEDILKKIKLIIDLDYASPFNSEYSIKMISTLELNNLNDQKLGSYGIIKGAHQFLIGIAKKQTKFSFENFGYVFENVILKLTEIGLGTCWIGGAKLREKFAQYLPLDNGEYIPAISPVGYAQEARISEKLIRMIIGAKKRKSWNKLFFEGNFNTFLDKNKSGNYTLPLEMVRLAPSAVNWQPWRVLKEIGKNIYHFYVIQTSDNIGRSYNNMRLLDIGIAICHFNLSVQSLKLTGKWKFMATSLEFGKDLVYKISWIDSNEV